MFVLFFLLAMPSQPRSDGLDPNSLLKILAHQEETPSCTYDVRATVPLPVGSRHRSQASLPGVPERVQSDGRFGLETMRRNVFRSFVGLAQRHGGSRGSSWQDLTGRVSVLFYFFFCTLLAPSEVSRQL